VRAFILRHVAAQPRSIAALTATEFGLSRTAVNGYLRRLIGEGLLQATGRTSARHYALKTIVDEVFEIADITRSVEEDAVWRFRVLPLIRDAPRNIIDICQHGFSEIFNNVIDHSLSDTAVIACTRTYGEIDISVADFGIGIFRKIQQDFGLIDARTALLELSKGKLTSDQARHAGEGIFFTSRMFGKFAILSGDLFYGRVRRSGDEWLVKAGDLKIPIEGTLIKMTISTDADWTPREVFDRYQGRDTGFRKTLVPVKLGRYPGEQLVSRSQAKRILARFDQFSEVMLDFEGVDDIGQPFADEMFRVFPLSHPEIEIGAINTNEKIDRMIRYVQSAAT